MKRHSAVAGFTMVELLVVVAIIAIVVAIALPQYQFFIVKSERTAALAFLSDIGKSQKSFLAAHDEFAPRMADLVLLGYCPLGPGCYGPFYGDSVESNFVMDQLGIAPLSSLQQNKAFRFEFMYVGVASQKSCVDTGFEFNATCGYLLEFSSDKDKKTEAVESRYDVYLVRENVPAATEAAFPGPNNGTAFMRYDDLLDSPSF